jgi:hypothetical protein
MAFRCLLVFPICVIGRKDRQDVNIRAGARKLLKCIGEAVDAINAWIMNGKGTPAGWSRRLFGVVREAYFVGDKSVWLMAYSGNKDTPIYF